MAKRNYLFLLFEIIACISVIFVHIRLPEPSGTYFELFARFAVIFFFMIAGFYLANENSDIQDIRRKLIKRIIRISILTVITSIVFILLFMYICRENLSGFFKGYYAGKYWLYLVLFNRPFLTSHIWFLLAMLYSYLFLLIFPKIVLKNVWLYIFSSLSLLFLILRFIAYQTDITILGLKVSDVLFYRNWLGTGLPFICLGALLRKLSSKLEKTNLVVLIIGLSVSLIMMFVEPLIYRKILKIHVEYGVFNIIFVVFVFILGIKYPSVFHNSKFLNIKGNWTMYVYLFHRFFIYILNNLANEYGWSTNNVYRYLAPFIVVIISLITALTINAIVTLIKERKTIKEV